MAPGVRGTVYKVLYMYTMRATINCGQHKHLIPASFRAITDNQQERS